MNIEILLSFKYLRSNSIKVFPTGLSKHSLTHRFPFLFQETELRLVKFLPEILALQRDLVRRFQNTAEVKHCSIREFLREPHSGEETLPKL